MAGACQDHQQNQPEQRNGATDNAATADRTPESTAKAHSRADSFTTQYHAGANRNSIGRGEALMEHQGMEHLGNTVKRRDSSGADDDDDDSSNSSPLSEALLAVASAEEYAAKITKLQQACLTPLKEDLAEWLNKILSVSTITTENFMHKLDNGVIICKLAKIVSSRCGQQQQPQPYTTSGQGTLPQQQLAAHNRTNSQPKYNQSVYATPTHRHRNNLTQTNRNLHITHSSKLSTSTNNVHSTININDKLTDVESVEPFYDRCNNNMMESLIATPLRQPQLRVPTYNNGKGPLRSFSQSINCLTSSSTTNLNDGFSSSNRFLNNLIWMQQTKIWEDAKCRTFYARDNVCNFIRWSKEFGVNQSVLFESDDLVLHANTRQVVLCLLDVARIACVKHGFTEAPGLIKFEQEINRELAEAEEAALGNNAQYSSSYGSAVDAHTNGIPTHKKRSSLARNSRGASIVDATDDLITRYCLHKEEEAARIKAAELEAAKLEAAEKESAVSASAQDGLVVEAAATSETLSASEEQQQEQEPQSSSSKEMEEALNFELDSLITEDKESVVMKSPSGESLIQKHNITYDNRVDSLDSGEGRTESASTSHSRTPVNTPMRKLGATSAIPLPIKRSNSSSSLVSNQTSSIGTSELSSSHSSLLSGQDCSSHNKRHIASDLDGKVMRIAKSYYGKGATKGVTRLSEGKYKIADRIVFVRLLKGHRVMVRIGGGWDTLENFLFRHKSDPSQVINLDNLLPIETKMSFKKNQPPTTPNN